MRNAIAVAAESVMGEVISPPDNTGKISVFPPTTVVTPSTPGKPLLLLSEAVEVELFDLDDEIVEL